MTGCTYGSLKGMTAVVGAHKGLSMHLKLLAQAIVGSIRRKGTSHPGNFAQSSRAGRPGHLERWTPCLTTAGHEG